MTFAPRLFVGCTRLREFSDAPNLNVLLENKNKMASLLASRLCGTTAMRFATLKKIPYRPVIRTFADDSREAVPRVARRRLTLKERIMAPAGEGGMRLGRNLIVHLLELCIIYCSFKTPINENIYGVRFLTCWSVMNRYCACSYQ